MDGFCVLFQKNFVTLHYFLLVINWLILGHADKSDTKNLTKRNQM